MMDDDSRSRLLRLKLELFGQFHVDPCRIEQLKQLRLILQIRAGGIAKAEARALIALPEKFIEVLCVAGGNAQFFADAPVPQLGHGLRSEEHTSELQSHVNLVCRLLLEKKK